jgi:hypothetical protein
MNNKYNSNDKIMKNNSSDRSMKNNSSDTIKIDKNNPVSVVVSNTESVISKASNSQEKIKFGGKFNTDQGLCGYFPLLIPYWLVYVLHVEDRFFNTLRL